MKKQLTVILLSALLLSGCASGRMGNPGAIMAGASIGGSLGSSIGGLIGDNNHGWRGGYRGSAIGNIVGTIAGAAIGNALTAPRQEQIEEDAYIPEVREVRVQKYKKQPVQQPISQLKLRKIRFIDDNRSHVIDAGENGVLSGVDLTKTLTREEYKERLDNLQKKLEVLHGELYRLRIPVVIGFEGWDAAGKFKRQDSGDGILAMIQFVIRSVRSGRSAASLPVFF